MDRPVQAGSETSLTIAVCGTRQRREQAEWLHTQISEYHTSMLVLDSVGEPTLNHAEAWRAAANGARHDDWVGVVEDDVICTPLMLRNLRGYLNQSPADVVSAYLGTGVPSSKQPAILAALREHSSGWLLSRLGVFSHVAIFAKARLAEQFAEQMTAQPNIACDTILDVHCLRHRIDVAFPVPSWVDHADGPTTVTHQMSIAGVRRRAHRYNGGDWADGATVHLSPLTRKS